MTSRLRSHRAPRPLRRAAISLPKALRRLRTWFATSYTRPMPISVQAATRSTATLSLHLSRALDAGATREQIHEAMDWGRGISYVRQRPATRIEGDAEALNRARLGKLDERRLSR